MIWKGENMNKQLKPVLYLQSDPRWGSYDYSAIGEKTNIKSEGCGITCAAMIIASLADKSVTPIITADWSKKNGYKALHQGTYYSYFKPQGAVYGIQIKMLNSTSCYHNVDSEVHNNALNAIKNGDWVIACMGKGNWTTSGHYILWYGLQNNNVLINDPWSIKPQQTNAPYSLFKNEVKYYWVITVPKKFKEDEMVERDMIVVNDTEYSVDMIRKDGTTFIKTRDIADILGMKVSSMGRIPVLKS